MATKFVSWIKDQGGPEGLSKTVGLTAHAVRKWVRGEGTPTAHMCDRLIKLSKGKISFSDIMAAKSNSKN